MVRFQQEVSFRAKQVTPAALLLVLLGCLAVDSRAQGEASIIGRIFDATSMPIAGAAITVKSTETGLIRKSLTDTSGHYNVSLLGVGNYEITAEMSGFQPETRRQIALVLGQRQAVDFVLRVSGLRETVQVTEQAPGVAVSTSDVSGLVGERQVKDLPLNGRSFDNLLTLNTGIVNVTAQRAGGVGTSASAVGNMFSGFRSPPGGKSFPSERSRIYRFFERQRYSRGSKRTAPGSGRHSGIRGGEG